MMSQHRNGTSTAIESDTEAVGPRKFCETACDERVQPCSTDRWALVLSALAVLVVSIFSFGLSSHIAGVGDETAKAMQRIQVLEATVRQLEQDLERVSTGDLRIELQRVALKDILRRLEGVQASASDAGVKGLLDEAYGYLEQAGQALDAEGQQVADSP